MPTRPPPPPRRKSRSVHPTDYGPPTGYDPPTDYGPPTDYAPPTDYGRAYCGYTHYPPYPWQVYPQHNLEMLVWCARVAGQRDTARQGAARLAQLAAMQLRTSPPEGQQLEAGVGPERYAAAPLLTALYLDDFAAANATPRPPAVTPFVRTAWHLARGVGAARAGEAAALTLALTPTLTLTLTPNLTLTRTRTRTLTLTQTLPNASGSRDAGEGGAHRGHRAACGEAHQERQHPSWLDQLVRYVERKGAHAPLAPTT